MNRSLWRDLRAALRPPRRLRVLRAGGFVIFGTFALGLATLNTGNNLLYLLMGALLGTISLSGWLSEQALRELHVTRVTPRAVTAGARARLQYIVHNGKRRLPSHGLEIREQGDALAAASVVTAAFAATLEPGADARLRAELVVPRRGLYALPGIVLATSFPFGLFAKERDLALPGSLVVWPRADRVVRTPVLGGRRGARREVGAGAAAGAERGEYRGLREYRPGDDPRDLHWRTTARRGIPILREYDRDAADEYWIVLDTVVSTMPAGEAAVEVAASLMAAAVRRGDRCGLVAGAARLPPGAGPGRVEAALDLLASVSLTAAGPAPAPPVPRAQCVLVTTRAGASGWGDVFTVEEAVPE